MKKIKQYVLPLLAAAFLFGCSDYDDSELKKDVNDLKSRVETLETWCNTVNGQITALQSLVTALEQKDYITGITPVMEGTKEIGYTLTFSKSSPITVLNGKDAETPVIGVKKDTDGKYYWTSQTGNALAEWVKDESGNKVPATGGEAPEISVAEFNGKLYWKVNGEWLLNNGNKVPATGEKGDKGDTGDTGNSGSAGGNGDSIFKSIDYTTSTDYVIITLADGVTKITLPRTNGVSIAFSEYTPFYCNPTNYEIPIILPATLKETDFVSMVATISNSEGSDMDIKTRSIEGNPEGQWGVVLTKPTFTNGVLDATSAKVTLTLPQNKTYYQALLTVSLIDTKGKDHTINRIVWFKAEEDANVVENTAGSLASNITGTLSEIKQLSIVGDVNETDFAYIRDNLTNLEVLDLSRTTLTELPTRAMAFYSVPAGNTVLKTVILPETLIETGWAAFGKCKGLTEINLPKGLKTITNWTFEGCENLTSVNIPSGVTTIGPGAFRECSSISSVVIPSGVTVLNEQVFYICKGLKSVVMHDNITAIGDDAFALCENIQDKNLVIPANVTSIGARAFTWTGMTSVKLPEGLQSIGHSAFNQCNIATIDLPSTVTSLHATAFLWSGATTVICRCATLPEIPTLDDHNNAFPPFYQISSSCILKVPDVATYSGWSSYFQGGIQAL